MIEVKGLRTHIQAERGVVRCVDGADFFIEKGETLGLVGESGSGKTMVARSIMGLVGGYPGVIAGEVKFRPSGSQTTLELIKAQEGPAAATDRGWLGRWRKSRQQRPRPTRKVYGDIWGKHMSIIFQDPQTSLNPFWTVGLQLEEAIRIGDAQREMTESEVRLEALQWLKRVHISFPETVLESHAHELSGGMCQRVMIAIALASKPELVIADEPTTGLDVTIQARIVELFKELKQELKLTMLLISHDMGLIGQLSNRVAVMYCGKVVECGPRKEILKMDGGTRHPYTEALLRSMPDMGVLRAGERLPIIADEVPDPTQPPTGCAFHPRCEVYREHAADLPKCSVEPPQVTRQTPEHWFRCWSSR